jgi:Lrp/AsnC family transcriptional regulator, leucine-responsive regulatory protein
MILVNFSADFFSQPYLAQVLVTSVSHLEQLIDRFIPYATITTFIVLSTPFAGRTIDNGIFK